MKITKIYKYLIGFFICINYFTINAQNNIVDSLNLALKQAKHDTVKCKILYELVGNSAETDWPLLNDQLIAISEHNVKISTKNTYLNKFYLNYYAKSLNNLGYLCDLKGDIQNALKNYNQSLKIQEQLGNKADVAELLNNLAYVYEHQGDFYKGLELYKKSYNILVEINQIDLSAYPLNNIGLMYSFKNDTTKALECFMQCLKIDSLTNNRLGVAQCYKNIASMYLKMKRYNKAFDNCYKSITIYEKFKDKEGLIFSYNLLGSIFYEQKNINKALEFSLKSMAIAKERGFPENIQLGSYQLFKIYQDLGDYKNALTYYKLNIAMRDSISNVKTKNAAIKSQFQSQYEKQALQDSVAHAKETQIKNIELESQRTEINAKKNQQYILFGGLFIVVVFAGFIFNRFKITQKQKYIIELKEIETQKQKEIIEEKHNQIDESIQYSREIQNKFLKLPKNLPSYIKNLLLIYQPKDVLSGDFYWYKEINNLFFIVVGDCTGHGVSGSIISVLAIQSFEKKINEIKSGDELHKINELIKIEFDQFYSENERVYIGLEYSILCFDKNQEKVFMSGSGSTILVKDSNNEVNSERFNSLNIGGSTISVLDNKTSVYHFENLNSVYLFTDGLIDQKGGEMGKKLGSNNLKKLVLNTTSNSENELKTQLINWKGNNVQIDDITFLGVFINNNLI